MVVAVMVLYDYDYARDHHGNGRDRRDCCVNVHDCSTTDHYDDHANSMNDYVHVHLHHANAHAHVGTHKYQPNSQGIQV